MGRGDQGGYYGRWFEAVAKQYHIDLNAPVDTIQRKINKILYGTGT
jgi:hypothetical protein